MIDFILVPSPFKFPYGCVGCQSQKGPLVDTHRELPGYGHVYWCPGCSKTAARLHGYAKGARLDELEAAAGVLLEREAEIESLAAQLAKANESRSDVVRHDQDISGQLTEAHERIAQLEGLLRGQADNALSLVGGDSAA